MTSFALLDIDRRYMVDSDGNVYGPRGLRKRSINNNGYLTVNTTNKRYSVHRLVAQAFIPNPENKPQVAHYDGSRTNSKAENLYWATNSENCLDKRRHGRNNGGTPKLDWEKVRYIRSHPVYRGSQRELAKRFGVNQVLISMVLLNKIWKEYNN